MKTCRTEGPCARNDCDCGFYDKSEVERAAPTATDITIRLSDMSETMWMDRSQEEVDALLLEAKGEIERLREGLKPRERCATDVLAERRRQVEAEGWTPDHDDQYRQNELTRAAVCYILGNPGSWPWEYAWWKPGDPRRNLVKAAALIIAEIERIDRAALIPSEQKGDADA